MKPHEAAWTEESIAVQSKALSGVVGYGLKNALPSAFKSGEVSHRADEGFYRFAAKRDKRMAGNETLLIVAG
jgi:hypothetical protein